MLWRWNGPLGWLHAGAWRPGLKTPAVTGRSLALRRGTDQGEAAVPGEGSASQGGSGSGLEVTQGVAGQHPVHSGGSLEHVRAPWEVGGKENGWENVTEVQVRWRRPEVK